MRSRDASAAVPTAFEVGGAVPALCALRARHRGHYLIAAALTIAAGLASRKFPGLLPAVLGKYPGDALYAVLIYWLVALVLNPPGLVRAAGFALGFCFAVELLQLWQTPWLLAIRANPFGHLVLGSHFHAGDLLAYAIGVLLAAALEAASLNLRPGLRPRGLRPGR